MHILVTKGQLDHDISGLMILSGPATGGRGSVPVRSHSGTACRHWHAGPGAWPGPVPAAGAVTVYARAAVISHVPEQTRILLEHRVRWQSRVMSFCRVHCSRFNSSPACRRDSAGQAKKRSRSLIGMVVGQDTRERMQTSRLGPRA
jgi:hypothetical protein